MNQGGSCENKMYSENTAYEKKDSYLTVFIGENANAAIVLLFIILSSTFSVVKVALNAMVILIHVPYLMFDHETAVNTTHSCQMLTEN